MIPCLFCDGDRPGQYRTPDGYAACVPCLLRVVADAVEIDPDDRPEDWGVTIDAPPVPRKEVNRMPDTQTLQVTSHFVFAKETKNTRKYDEVPEAGNAPIIGALYVQKHVAHNLGNPEVLRVTVAPA